MFYQRLLIVVLILVCGVPTYAIMGIPATEDSISQLKRAIRGGIIQIGKTRLKEINEVYGYPSSVVNDESRIVYDYGDIRVEFTKKKVWKMWEYDSFKRPVYTKDADDLRFDLESGELIGKNITFRRVRKDYGEPTESMETDNDGEQSTYYYGNIKLVFENVVILRSLRGTTADDTGAVAEGVLKGE